MNIGKYLMMSCLGLLATACQKEEQVTVPTPGTEVQFGVSLKDGAGTRTVYGEENNNAFPIYWVNGDQILVTSPQCLVGRNTAVYSVEVGAANQDYATSLKKTGASGVQWGTQSKADFYSAYPASKVSLDASGTKFQMSMPSEQYCVVKRSSGKLTAYPDMDACFMYAKTVDASVASQVNLQYKPLSTAIRFTVQVKEDDDLKNDGVPIIVSKILLHAPDKVAIAGDFTVELSGETPIVSSTSTVNEISIVPLHDNGAFLSLYENESVELNAFVAPLSGLEITNEWYIQIVCSDGRKFKKSLGAFDGKNRKIAPGKIHRLPSLPNITHPNNSSDWNPDSWIEHIPRNIYLSEMSLPGTWNSLNGDFQATTSISDQYNMGVRAFHLDTRWGAKSKNLAQAVQDKHVTYLSVANGGATEDVRKGSTLLSEKLGKVMWEQRAFSDYLNDITSLVKPNEYMIVFCTFAQGSYNKIFDDDDKTNWMKAVSAACKDNENVFDASLLTPNTVIDDVEGKVIVIVNTTTSVASADIPEESKCLFTYIPMELKREQYSDKTFNSDFLYYAAQKKESGISMANCHAQISSNDNNTPRDHDRGYAPTLSQRTTELERIMQWSCKNYADPDYQHDSWIYLGLGGYQVSSSSSGAVDKSYAAIANTYNDWIVGKIQNMSATPKGDQTTFYPVGIVLMNNKDDSKTDTYKFKNACSKILQLNNSYRKASDPNRKEK